MTQLTHAHLTVPEAAFVAGLTAKDINREIDAHIIDAGPSPERRLKGSDLFYLLAVKDVRDQLGPGLRRNIRAAIDAAVTASSPEATVHRLVFSIERLRSDLIGPFEALERSKHDRIESRPDVLGGEPVLKGTRIAARHVADLLRKGATRAEIADDLDLDEAQIEAAVVFDQTSPRRGRPVRRARAAPNVPVA